MKWDMWDIRGRGFLPENDPIKVIPNVALEGIAKQLPDWIESRRIREEAVYHLRRYPVSEAWLRDISPEQSERALLIYSFLSAAYVYARYEEPAKRLPVEIARPLFNLSYRKRRQPILSYASYCLYNWRRFEPDKPVELGNIELLQNFCHPDNGKTDEDWFILIHVDIEAKASAAMEAIKLPISGPKRVATIATIHDVSGKHVRLSLEQLRDSLIGMNATLARMPEQCSPDKYFHLVRPYIWSFENVEYEGVLSGPQTFRGETGAQSSTIPAICGALGIVHKDTVLTQHLSEMREYMPEKHRNFVALVEKHSSKENFRTFAQGNGSKAHGKEIRKLYNQCVQEVLKFRIQHIAYAVEYIMNKVKSPTGTGGTPYGPWLNQLKDETEAHLLS
jgi:indoleamine 2,3-dioxygenase